MNAFDVLLKAVRVRHIFKRNKCTLETKVFACLLYMAGISYRGMTFQTGMIGASHVSVYNWVHRLGTLTSRVPKRKRECIAVDESKLKANKSMLFVWSAIDVETKELLAVYASYQRSSLNTIWFMRRVLRTCRGRKPRVLVDGGPWYPWALERMGFEWEHVTWGRRNAIERLFRTVKERTRRFYNNISSRVSENKLTCVTTFLEVFMLWYNHLRKHQTLGRVPVMMEMT
jgi:putative transposase